jgi:hypothetical protein
MQEAAMFRRLLKLLGFSRDDSIPQPEYDPVYGLPRRSLEEWLARNPQLREEYEVLAWLARNPSLRQEYEVARKQGLIPLVRASAGRDSQQVRVAHQHS